jgi:carboxyl-terminal processing protease
VPEITLPSLISTTEVGESTRDSALPWDRIRPVEFDSERALSGTVGALTERHQERMASDADLRALVGDTEAVEKLRAEKTVSLNLAKRKAERERLDAERLARINARRAADDQPALKTLEELDPEQEPDANLREASEILADLIAVPGASAPQLSQTQAKKTD